MVFLQAVASPDGPSARCVEHAFEGRCELFISDETIDEMNDVLNRPKLRKKFARATPENVAEFIRRVLEVATRLGSVPSEYILKRDVKDSKYINLAVAASAKLIVSRDNDLLDLMTGNDDEATRFRTTYPEIAILDPVAFLKTIEPDAGGGL